MVNSIDLADFSVDGKVRLGTGTRTYSVIFTLKCKTVSGWITGITLRPIHDPEMTNALDEAFKKGLEVAIKDGRLRKNGVAVFRIGSKEWPTAPIVSISTAETNRIDPRARAPRAKSTA